MNGTDKLKKLFGGERLTKLMVIAGVVGVALLFLSNYISFGSSKENENFSVKSYGTQVEKDLESAISHIEGAGKTKVLLTMENSVEYVYLNNSTTKTKEVEPLIRGVLVLCDGGDDPVVVGRITEAVTKALDISSAKVCITKLSE